MGNYSIKGKDLSKIGFVNDVSRSMAIMVASRHFKHTPKNELLQLLLAVKENPESFLQHETLGPLAQTFITRTIVKNFETYHLNPESEIFKIYGGKHIDGAAKRQMELAMRLPVAVQGALMPDAHMGFGLPIGGVLAVENAVIPYAVGLDIGCRMALSIFELPEKYLQKESYQLKKVLGDKTHFGINGGISFAQEHPVLEHPDFNATPLLQQLHGKAVKQLGSSGSGNHFVEFGVIELFRDNPVSMPAGKYLGLLSHSGSRGLGAAIAKYYTNLAMDACKLPKQAQNLAWLSLDTEAGQEYWLSMQLAGAYAQACHDQIHYNLAKAMGEKAVVKIENHHNFAWPDSLPDGRKVIIHRKGATPAHTGELGIIPGSMTAPGFLVSGKGCADALFSASHGAGRRLSRGRAKESFTVSGMKKILSAAGVTLLGGSPEECPLAYKDIDTVMQGQSAMVEVHGKFLPKIVRMNKE